MCYNFDAEALRKVTMFFKNKNISKNWARYFYGRFNLEVHNQLGC
jgi:hypothetical protein